MGGEKLMGIARDFMNLRDLLLCRLFTVLSSWLIDWPISYMLSPCFLLQLGYRRVSIWETVIIIIDILMRKAFIHSSPWDVMLVARY